MQMDWNDLDLNNIVAWPLWARSVAIVFLGIVIILLGYWMDTKKQLVALKNAKAEELKLRASFEDKRQKAANLKRYKDQMTIVRTSFGTLLRQLPEKTEVPGLIEDISRQGLAAGLEFRTIRLLPEEEGDFCVKLPIEISVVGGYHQFGVFVSNIAALPRIVTLDDFFIRPIVQDTSSDNLIMNITANTYRMANDKEKEENEVSSESKNEQK